jgi:hypothetical protein
MRGEVTMRPCEATLTDVAPQGIITEMAAGKEVSSDLAKSCFLCYADARITGNFVKFFHGLIRHILFLFSTDKIKEG